MVALATLLGALALAGAPVASAEPGDDWLNCVLEGGTLYIPSLGCCHKGSICIRFDTPLQGALPDL